MKARLILKPAQLSSSRIPTKSMAKTSSTFFSSKSKCTDEELQIPSIKTAKKIRFLGMNDDFANINSNNDNDINLLTEPISSYCKSTTKDTHEYTSEIDEKDMKEEHRRCENEIKKLNFWDTQNIIPTIKSPGKISLNSSKVVNKKNSSTYIKKDEIESINWMLEIKERPQEINLFKRNKYLKEFFTKIEEEQRTIFLQSMNINKKQFRFEVFNQSLNPEAKVKEFQENLSKVDYYREVMKEKVKLEEVLKNELMASSKVVFRKKQEKKELLEIQLKLTQDLQKLRGELEYQKDEIKREKQELQNQIDTITNNIRNHEAYNEDHMFYTKSRLMTSINEKDEELQKMKEKLNREKEAIETELENTGTKLLDIESEMKELKGKVVRIIKEHRNYYFDILKKGIDVRHEGLCWVVRKLLELNAYIEYSQFPKFLDHSQVDYLISIAYKQLECNQLVTILKVLINRQKKIREELSNKKTCKLFHSSGSIIELNNEPRLNTKDKLIEAFEQVNRKYDNMHCSYQQLKEDLLINRIVKILRKRIIQHLNKESDKDRSDDTLDLIDGLYFLPNSLAQFFSENKNFRQSFEGIYILREEIGKLEKEIDEMKSNEIKLFKRKYEMSRYPKNSVHYEMVFAAMFGNGILI